MQKKQKKLHQDFFNDMVEYVENTYYINEKMVDGEDIIVETNPIKESA